MFSSHSMIAVGLTPQARGLILAYMGILITLMQGGIIGKLTKKFQEISLLNLSSFILVFSLLPWSFVTNIYQLIIKIPSISFAAAIQNVLQKSLLSKSAVGDNQGMILGVSTSMESLTRIIAPLFGGFLLSRTGLWSPGVFSALILIIPFILVTAERIRIKTVTA